MSYRPYSVYKAERLRRRRRRWLLFGVAGVVLVVCISVLGVYLWGYVQWGKTQITDEETYAALESTPDVENPYPTPEGTTNILVLGVDQTGYSSVRSDSLMIVHVDPANNYLSTLSLPRDLRVEVPGSGMQKLNYAYAHGGQGLVIETVQLLTGVNITEYLEIDYNAFKSLTNAVGGVLIDVDKHYLQTNPAFERADIRPGYQRLYGADGLDYVRYRKDANLDFGRQQRQQRYLTALREQAMGWGSVTNLPGIVSSLTDNIETTIGYNAMLHLAAWAVTDMDSGRIRQLVVLGSTPLIDGVYYTVPAEGVLEQKVKDLMTPPTNAEFSATTLPTTPGTTPATARNTVTVDRSGFATDLNNISDVAMWRQIATDTPFQVMAPGYLPKDYSYVDRNPQSGPGYEIDTGDGIARGLKIVYELAGGKDQYLGIMETTWQNAPAASPGKKVVYNGTTYTIVGGVDYPERIWWRHGGVLYWVSNTIMHYLDSEELIKVAASMMTVPNGATTP